MCLLKQESAYVADMNDFCEKTLQFMKVVESHKWMHPKALDKQLAPCLLQASKMQAGLAGV